MSNELTFAGDPATDSGLTIVGRVYSQSGATWSQLGSDVTMTESGTLALYVGDMPTAAAGAYLVRFFNGATLIKQQSITWDGSSEIDQQSLNARLTTIIADVGAITVLTQQEVRDAMKTAHTDGNPGIDAQISNVVALIE